MYASQICICQMRRKTHWQYPASILQSYLRDIIDIYRCSTSPGLTSILLMNFSAREERGEYSLLEINVECIPFKMRFVRFREVKELNSHKEDRQRLREFRCTDSRQGLFHQQEICQRGLTHCKIYNVDWSARQFLQLRGLLAWGMKRACAEPTQKYFT